VQLVLVGLLIGAAFFIGSLWTKVQTMEQAGSAVFGQKDAQAPTAPTAPPTNPTKAVKDLDPVSDGDYYKGNKDAKIVLFEYSDLDCPFCKRFHPTAEEALKTYGDDFMWVFRHFPLDALHPDARARSEASECAGKLGGNDAFWAFIDAVNAVDAPLESADVAVQIGLDLGAFNACVASGETADAVEADYKSGLKAGVTGTPGNILLNTETQETTLLPGAVPFNMIQEAVDELLGN